MALTLNNYTGFETGGAEEASVITGTPLWPATTPRTGGRKLQLNSSEAYELPWVSGGATDAGTKHIFFFAFNSDSGTGRIKVRVFDGSSVAVIGVSMNTSGQLSLTNAGGISQLDLATSDYRDSAWHTIAVYADLNSASGAWEWWVDNVSEGSGSGADFTNGNAFGTASSGIEFGAFGGTPTFDDVYILSGATATTDKHDDFEVFNAILLGPATVTPTAGMVGNAGTDLDAGTWADVDNTPDTGGVSADYTASTTDQGTIDSAALSTYGDIDGDANIIGMKGIWRGARSGGSGSTFTAGIGNDGDINTVGHTINPALTTTVTNYFLLTETDLPVASTDKVRMGIAKNNKGQNWELENMWGTLAHVPASAGVSAAIVQAVDTEIGQAIVPLRTRTVALASDTEIGQIVRPVREIAVTQATGADTGFAMTHSIAANVVQATDTEIGQTVTPERAVAVAQATGADTGFVVVPAVVIQVAVTQASETDIGNVMTAARGYNVIQGLDTEIAQPTVPLRAEPLGQASGADTAFNIDHAFAVNVVQASELALGFDHQPLRTYVLGQPSETDVGFTAENAKSVALGLASTSATAFALSVLRGLNIGQALETDAGFLVKMHTNVGIATTTAEAFVIVPQLAGGPQIIPVAQAVSTDTALSMTIDRAITVVQATEADTGFAVGKAKIAFLNLATVAEIGQPLTIDRAVTVGEAVEADTGFTISVAKALEIGLVTESDTGFVVIANRAEAMGLAGETATAFNIDHAKAGLVGIALEADTAFQIVGQEGTTADGGLWMLFRRRR